MPKLRRTPGRRDSNQTASGKPGAVHLNNIVEQDHRAIKRLVRPMLGFKSFRSAAVTLAGIELMHMVRKGQLRPTGEVRPAQQF
jgi:transposase-like protein